MLDKGKFGSSRQMEGCENVRKKTPVRIISTFYSFSKLKWKSRNSPELQHEYWGWGRCDVHFYYDN